MKEIFVAPVEAELIRKYEPVWNTIIDGFGNHDPGSGRYNQAPSEWDVIHPGRLWASRLTGKPPALQDIIAKLNDHLS
ncbi:MAG: Eco29kI family restriction endonuclease [Dehalococcoidales bacterium]|nr:Eco29kI family restriction endonuclease [Dehalococcoidales bacterium]